MKMYIDNKLEKYEAIDYCKLIMAFLVITIHVPPMAGINEIVNYYIRNYLARIAVPFFFFCNGYFTVINCSDTDILEKGRIQAKKFIRLYLIWTCLYFPLISLGILKSGNMMKGLLMKIKDTIFYGSYLHLWYLPAAAVAILMVSAFYHFKKLKYWLLPFAFLLYCIGICYDEFFSFLDKLNLRIFFYLKTIFNSYLQIFSTTANGIFFGFLFVGLGAYFARANINISFFKSFIGFIISLFILFLEAAFIGSVGGYEEHSMYFMLIPETIFLFLCLKQLHFKIVKTSRLIRALSTMIYFIHPWFAFIFSIVGNHILQNTGVLNIAPIKYCIVVFSTTIISLIILKYEKIPSFYFLKKLH